MKKVLSGLALCAATIASPAFAAATITTENGSAASYAAPAGATTVINFNTGNVVTEAAGKGYTATVTGNAKVSANSETVNGEFFLRPEPSDSTNFFAVGKAGSLKLLGGVALSQISVFIGSIDDYNVVSLLDAAGNALETYDGFQIAGVNPFPGNTTPSNNRRVTFTGNGTTNYYGVSFSNKNGLGSLEFDNVALTAAVPEPGTWLTMILGFGVVGAAMRRRKSSATSRIQLV